MQKIIPHLWFDTEAVEAAKFYTAVFPDSKVVNVATIHNTPSGDCDMVHFELLGHRFMAISAGPFFKVNPSISFSVFTETAEEVDALWNKLIEGGKALMEINSYPWSERYGWVQDTYGVSWQIMVNKEVPQKLVPHLMFTKEVAGRAEEAMEFYTSVFKDSPSGDSEKSEVGSIFRYEEGQGPDEAGTVAHATFTLLGQQFGAMDSAQKHDFIFNEAISLMVMCDTQEEIDYYWEKLSAVPESEQCGWLKDKFGVSWQIVPSIMDELLAGDDRERVDRVTQVFLKMKKFNIAALEAAAEGK